MHYWLNGINKSWIVSWCWESPIVGSSRTFVLPFKNNVCHLYIIWILMYSDSYIGSKWWWMSTGAPFFKLKNISHFTIWHTDKWNMVLQVILLCCYTMVEAFVLLPLLTNKSCTFSSLRVQFRLINVGEYTFEINFIIYKFYYTISVTNHSRQWWIIVEYTHT